MALVVPDFYNPVPFSPLPDDVDIVSRQADSLERAVGTVVKDTVGTVVKDTVDTVGTVVGGVGAVVGGVGAVVGGVGEAVKEVGSAVQTLSSAVKTSALQKKLNSWMRDEIEMRSVKILDIGYIAVLYFVMGVIITRVFDKLFGEWSLDVDSRKSTLRIGLELVGMTWLFGVTTYIVRNLIERIPSPMSYIPLSNPERKFEHRRVKELSSATVFTLILMGTSYHFRLKLEYFYKRITGRVSGNEPVFFM